MKDLITINQAIKLGLKVGDTVKFANGKVRVYREAHRVQNQSRSVKMYYFINEVSGKGFSYSGATLIDITK
jgi:hypothetical protein